jgi:hypothetical protein
MTPEFKALSKVYEALNARSHSVTVDLYWEGDFFDVMRQNKNIFFRFNGQFGGSTEFELKGSQEDLKKFLDVWADGDEDTRSMYTPTVSESTSARSHSVTVDLGWDDDFFDVLRQNKNIFFRFNASYGGANEFELRGSEEDLKKFLDAYADGDEDTRSMYTPTPV